MARKAFYDRNPLAVVKDWNGTVGSHSSTTRWTYTVPTDRKAYVAIANGKLNNAFSAGKKGSVGVTLDGVNIFLYGVDSTNSSAFNYDSKFLGLYVTEGIVFQGSTFHNYTSTHPLKIGLVCLEFDE